MQIAVPAGVSGLNGNVFDWVVGSFLVGWHELSLVLFISVAVVGWIDDEDKSSIT